MNLQQDSEEPYDACPYCLTEIVVDDEPTIASAEPETFEPEETEAEEKESTEEQVEIPETPSECSYQDSFYSYCLQCICTSVVTL